MKLWFFLFLLPTVALAKTNPWPQLYNEGVTAYHSNDFSRAAGLFENATASTDRTLQQRALYNLGNVSYRLGEVQKPQAQQLWQRAIKNYESALALDPNDPDAKFNHEFVKKKLEELKKQQQQQNEKNQDQKKDDQQKNDQQQQQQNKTEDKQPQQQQQAQEDQKKEKQKHQGAQQKEQSAEQPQESKPEQPPEPKEVQPQDYGKMAAKALLDNLREEERNWNFFPEVQMKDLKDSGEPAKDW